MQVRQRLKINVAVSVISALIILLVLFTALYRVNRAMKVSDIADKLVASSFERSIFREDYLRNNNERAKIQWFARHEQIGKLLKAASEGFWDAEDKRTVNELIKDHRSTEKLFSAIVESREKRGPEAQSAALSKEIENRLSTQLNMRLNDKILNIRKLQDSASESLFSAIRLAGLGIFSALAIIIAAVLLNSWIMGRIITDRILRLRDGARRIGEGNLDHRIDIKGDDELAELSTSFDAMTAKLHGSYDNLKEEITERKRADEALRKAHDELEARVKERTAELSEQSRRMEAFLKHSLSPLVFLDKQFNFIRVNEAYARVCARDVSDFVGHNHFVDYPSEELKGKFERVIKTKERYSVLYRPFVFPDHPEWGTTYWDLFVYPVLDDTGEVDFLIFSLNDVTERKRAEEAIKNERKRLYDVLETLPAMICLLTPDYHVAFANKSFRDRFGESNGRPCYDYCFGKTGPCEFCESYNVLKTGQPHYWEVSGPDGSVIAAHDFPFADIDGSPLILEMDIDITKQRQAEKALKDLNETLEQRVAERTDDLQAANIALRDSRRAALNLMEDSVAARGKAEDASAELRREAEERKQAEAEVLKLSEDMAARNVELESVNRELEAFIYSISHDLRAPVRTMAGFARFLSEDYEDKLDDQAKDYLRRINLGSEKMTLLINDLLRLSKISRQEFDRMDIDLSKLASSVISGLRASDPGRSVEVSIAEELMAFADLRLMEIVLSNLLENAWKFTSKTEKAQIEFGALRHAQGNIVYFIKDNGAGFNPEYVEKMFWPFQRLHSAEEFEGTGIGLTIVERIIHRHGGKVWAEGEVGKGATVYFTLGQNLV